MISKMRTLIQIALTTSLLLTGAAQAQTAAVATQNMVAAAAQADHTLHTNAYDSTAQRNVSVSAAATGNHADALYGNSVAAQTSSTAPDKAQFSVVPEVGIWTLLAALFGLMLMRIWLSNKRKLSAIR